MASLLLGGGTRSGFLSDAALQLVSVPLLLGAIWSLKDCHLPEYNRPVWAFWLLIIGVHVAQLVPLPPGLWAALPQRAQLIVNLDGAATAWMPLSVSPTATWLALLSLIPPLAVFLAAIQLSLHQRRNLSLIVLAFAVVSVFLGLAQLSQGANSVLRFFSHTNTDDSVGFFANRNHFSAFLYIALLIAVVWAWAAVSAVQAPADRQRPAAWAVFLMVVALLVLVLLLVGQVMTRSRAGLALTIIALFGAFAVAISDRRSIANVTPAKMLGGAVVLVALMSTQYALYRIIERFGDDPLKDARIPFARNTYQAAKAFMPFGSGVGTFVPVYGLFEKPQDSMLDFYANRAHNDILEMSRETGVAGLVLFAIFALWLMLRAAKIWVTPSVEGHQIDLTLARAAAIAVVLVIAHSFVDYPLRTNAMMALVAFLCALLVSPPVTNELGVQSALEERPPAPLAPQRPYQHDTRHEAWTQAPSSPGQDVTPAAQPQPSQRGGRWGETIEWPEAWRNDKPPDPARKARDPPSNS